MTDSPASNDAELFAQRGFGQCIGFGERPALIIIDMATAFTDETAALGSNLDSQIAAIVPVLAAARARDIPIFFSTVRYDDRQMRDAGLWALKQKGLATLTVGTDGWKIDKRLDFRETDTLLIKKYASCFFGTDLGTRLTADRVDTLIVTGCTTSGCVRATSVDAVQYGFRPIVVREAVGDRSASAHVQSLFDLNAKYADVVGLEDALQYLTTFGHNRQ
jgi:nicotinamidase-related amidase